MTLPPAKGSRAAAVTEVGLLKSGNMRENADKANKRKSQEKQFVHDD